MATGALIITRVGAENPTHAGFKSQNNHVVLETRGFRKLSMCSFLLNSLRFSHLRFFFSFMKLLSYHLSEPEWRCGLEQKVQIFFTFLFKSLLELENNIFPCEHRTKRREEGRFAEGDHTYMQRIYESVRADLQVSRSAFHPLSAANYFTTRLSPESPGRRTCEPPASPDSSFHLQRFLLPQ